MKYFDEAKYLWKTYVPKRGQAETVQGELIRSVEKLRDEACRNGNCNWDKGFELFCDFIEHTLCGSDVFDSVVKEEIKSNIDRLRNYDNPYTEDDIFDDLTDRIVEWCRVHPTPLAKP